METTPESFGGLTRHRFPVPTGLRDVSTRDLGGALLHRLRQQAADRARGSYNEEQDHLALFSAIHEHLDRLVDVPENRLAPALAASQFHFVRHCSQRHGLPLQGAVHVDIGCGIANPFARMFTHLMVGVRRAYCVELDPLPDLGAALRPLARLASAALVDPSRVFGAYPIQPREILANLEGFDLARLQMGDPRGLAAERLQLLARPIEDTGLAAASVDVVISNSVLEHLRDVDRALAELSRITRPGGFAIHGIDVVDHRWYGDPSLHPLEFLTIPGGDPIVFNCNRLRLPEYERLFTHHGFAVLERWRANPIAIGDELRARLVEPWRSMDGEELGHGWTAFLIRKA